MKRFKPSPNLKYNRLTSVSEEGVDSHGQKNWKFVCECGNEIIARFSAVKSGNTKSCGCWDREVASKKATTHGHSGVDDPYKDEYRIWRGMKKRASGTLTGDKNINYSKKNISICESWKESFVNFLNDMGKRPSPKHSIDRIDNNGNYEPTNCRWATPKEQARNRSSNRLLTYAGETKTLAEWAEITGISGKKINSRISKLGWSIEKALETA